MKFARAHPFVKWLGSKRKLTLDITQYLPSRFGMYYEPFLGGGAVFFSMDAVIDNAYLSDVNQDLIRTYTAIKENVEDVIELLEQHDKNNSKEYYYQIRQEGHVYECPIKIAARFVYLNKTCFNGLYRVNKNSQFNAAWGYYEKPLICDRDNLLAVNGALQKTQLAIHSFEQIEPKEGDLVYCDPPYDETFQRYTKKVFGVGGTYGFTRQGD